MLRPSHRDLIIRMIFGEQYKSLLANDNGRGGTEVLGGKPCLNVTTASSESPGLRSNQGPGCEMQALRSMGRPNKYERVISVY